VYNFAIFDTKRLKSSAVDKVTWWNCCQKNPQRAKAT